WHALHLPVPFLYPSRALTLSTFPFSFFLSSSGAHRALHSFPTRRSSDLARELQGLLEREVARRDEVLEVVGRRGPHVRELLLLRSEEHTSELQSRENLVCRLLLEKKMQCYPELTVDIDLTGNLLFLKLIF